MAQHAVVLTNQNDGLLFALDYCVAVEPSGVGSAGATATVAGGGNGGVGGGATVGTSTFVANGTNPGATAVFPSQGASSGSNNHNGSAAAAIGGTLGALAAIVNSVLR